MMEDLIPRKILPGEIFEIAGERLMTIEGRMSGTVTLRTQNEFGETWNLEVIGVEKPEWEWMLGKPMRLPSSMVKEQIEKNV
jgi:hypothetical protein